MTSFLNHGDYVVNSLEVKLQDSETNKSLKDEILHSLLEREEHPSHVFNKEEQQNVSAFI